MRQWTTADEEDTKLKLEFSLSFSARQPEEISDMIIRYPI